MMNDNSTHKQSERINDELDKLIASLEAMGNVSPALLIMFDVPLRTTLLTINAMENEEIPHVRKAVVSFLGNMICIYADHEPHDIKDLINEVVYDINTGVLLDANDWTLTLVPSGDTDAK
jgi:hypothetical protein